MLASGLAHPRAVRASCAGDPKELETRLSGMVDEDAALGLGREVDALIDSAGGGDVGGGDADGGDADGGDAAMDGGSSAGAGNPAKSGSGGDDNRDGGDEGVGPCECQSAAYLGAPCMRQPDLLPNGAGTCGHRPRPKLLRHVL